MKIKKIIWIPLLVIVLILLIGWIGLDHLRDNPENPISYSLAEYFAKQHKEKHFPDTNYELSPARYFDKDDCYYISFTLPDSPDSYFQLGYNHIGVLTRNNYEYLVGNKGNTAIRLYNGYSAEVRKTIISMPESIEYNELRCYGSLSWRQTHSDDDSTHIIIASELELDGVYDLSKLGAKAGHIEIWVELTSAEQATIQNMATVLLHVRETMDNANLPFYSINCNLRFPNGTFSKWLKLENFLYEDITEKNLEASLEKVVSYM